MSESGRHVKPKGQGPAPRRAPARTEYDRSAPRYEEPAPRRQAPRYEEPAPRRQAAPRYEEPAPRRQVTPRYEESPRRAPARDSVPRRSAPRRRSGRSVLLLVLLAAVAVLVVILAVKLLGGRKPSAEPAAPLVTAQPGQPVSASPEIAVTPEPTPAGPAARLENGLVLPADRGVVIPERPTAVFDSFFDNSCLLGNSLIDGFRMWSGITNCRYICDANMWVNKVLGVVDLSPITLNEGYYNNVYLMFGLNEIGTDVTAFIRSYGEVLDFIRQYQPTANLCVISVTPVTAEVDADSGEVATRERILTFNEALKQMCAEKGCWYLDLYSQLLDDEGFLSADYAFSGDGKHFEKSGYVLWANYMRNHYIDDALVSE